MPTAKAYTARDDAARYDAARALPAATLTLWLDAVERHLSGVQVRAILDLGCGTGRFTAPLCRRFGCRVIGVDPSAAMLEVAARESTDDVEWRQGGAERIPAPDAAVDAVFMSQVLHHIEDRPAALAEIRRVLTPQGRLLIRNGTRENNALIEWLRCFPEALVVERRRDVGQQELIDVVCAHGFRLNSWETIYQVFAASYDEYFDKIRGRGLSSLISIPDTAFVEGLVRLREWIDRQPETQEIREPTDLFAFVPQ